MKAKDKTPATIPSISEGASLNQVEQKYTPLEEGATQSEDKTNHIGNEANQTKTTGRQKQEKTKFERVEDFVKKAWKLRYNLIKHATEVRDGEKWGELDERRASSMEAKLLRAGFTGVTRNLHIILQNASDFDPVTAYLDGLPAWDGIDHIQKLCGFIEVEPARRDFFVQMMRKHLLRMVSSLTGRIAFNKHCVVFVSNQNDGKTSFFRWLCPPEWREYYTENIDFESKDGLITLARNVIVNLDELKNLSKQDANKVKSFLSMEKVKARLPFDRRETNLRRNATFFGSTNNGEFLTDETGNVRWLVFDIQSINHDNGGANGYAGQMNINKLYAQVYHLVKSGETGQLTKEEIYQSENNNGQHIATSPEFEALIRVFKPCEKTEGFYTAADLAKYLENEGYRRVNSNNVGKACRQLKWDRVKMYIPTERQGVFGYAVKPRRELGPEGGALQWNEIAPKEDQQNEKNE